MLIGAMNHPGRPVLDEIKWMSDLRLDFIDLTLEPPLAMAANIDLAELSHLLDPLPKLGLHLDIGHANLGVPYNTTDEIIAASSHRLRHVHLHHNKGGSVDLHLPLGVGHIDVPRHLRALKASGYDGTITLEVFTPATLRHSRNLKTSPSCCEERLRAL